MATGYRETREQKAYERLDEKYRELLSEAGIGVLQQARSAANAASKRRDYGFRPHEYYEATQKMRRLAAELTDRDHIRLLKLARAALTAATAALDQEDALPWDRWYLGKLYLWNRTVSNLLADLLLPESAKEWLNATSRVEVPDLPYKTDDQRRVPKETAGKEPVERSN